MQAIIHHSTHAPLLITTTVVSVSLLAYRLRRKFRRLPLRFGDFLNNLGALAGPMAAVAGIAAVAAAVIALLSHAVLAEILLFAALAALGAVLFFCVMALLFALIGGDR